MADNTVTFPINIFIKDNKVFAQFENLNQTINVVNDSVNNVSQTINNQLAKINLNTVIDMIGKVGEGFKSLVGSSLDFEKQQQNLKTLLKGDADAASELVKNISEYAGATGLSRSALIEAQKTMMSFGIGADKAFSSLQNIADVAMGDKDKINSLSLAFSQMTSTGKLMGQDLLQMINAGFNPLAIMSERTGVSVGELKDQMSKGAISAEMVADAFRWATEEGGQFYNGAAAGADTVAGKIEIMKARVDDWKIALFNATGGATAYIAEIATMAGDLSNLIPLVSGVSSVISFLTNAQKMSALWTGIVTKAQWLWNAAMTANPVGLVIAGVAALVAAITVCWNKFAGFRAFLITVWDTFKEFGNIIKDFVIDRIMGIIEGLGAVGRSIAKLFSGDFNGAWEEAKTAGIKLTGIDAAARAINQSTEAVQSIGETFNANLEMERQKEVAKKTQEMTTSSAIGTDTSGLAQQEVTSSDLSKSLKTTSDKISTGGNQVKNINIKIDRVIDSFTVHTEQLKESAGRIRDLVREAIVEGINDVNLAAS